MTHQFSPELDQPLAEGKTGAPLTRKESREIITPYAFEVSQELWGVPTASPLRRLVAIGIDALLISMLANASFFAIPIAMGFLMWCRWQVKKYRQVLFLAVVTALLLATAAADPELLQAGNDKKSKLVNGLSQTAQMTGDVIAMQQADCDQACMDKHLARVARRLPKQSMSYEDAQSFLDGLIEDTDYDRAVWPEQREKLLAAWQQTPDASGPAVAKDAPVPVTAKTEPASPPKAWYEFDDGEHSLIAWAKGILKDFGFGVGWAMFYFTFMLAWCHGQTIGKKLLGIRVLQLDGEELSLFTAFSRQGGYGAGFATGLLGFFQVFWDPNRQAIHDKIASSVVIRVNQPKRPLTH